VKGIAFCTASSYSLQTLHASCVHAYPTQMYNDALQVEVPQHGPQAILFYFNFGAVIFWAMDREMCEPFLRLATLASEQPNETVEQEAFTFSFGPHAKIVKEEIILPSQKREDLLATSYGLGHSIKLGALETALIRTFILTRHIPEELSRRGKIVLSRKEMRKMIGQLFLERNSINLQCDMLGTPDYFWENPELEPLYLMTSHHFELDKRIKVLNARLSFVH
jgi:uncharacterized Rmd1/YagE family protein